MLTLYDAPRCPYCARTRIVLAEKAVPYETVTVDLANRPAWIVEHNPPHGRVPVLEDGGWVLPESAVIDEYLDERFPEPPLLPLDPSERAAARLVVFRFDDLGDPYYAFRRKEPGAEAALADVLHHLDGFLAATPFLTGRSFGLADIAYLPWILRLRDLLGVVARRPPGDPPLARHVRGPSLGRVRGRDGRVARRMSDATTSEVAERLGEAGLVLLDVRRADEFAGDLVAPCDPRPGHIPGALNVELSALLEARGSGAVRELVGAPAGAEVIAYCHSGSRSALAAQILVAAGYVARNYPGSWHEWSRDPMLPAEVGG